MNLYLVNLKGLKSAYVLAEDTTSAYNKFLKKLNENDIGFKIDRELKSIELIANDDIYNKNDTWLVI